MHLAGDGICTEICPELFGMHSDGLAYVKEADWADIYNAQKEPQLKMGQTALVLDKLLETAIEAAEECPGECIFFDA